MFVLTAKLSAGHGLRVLGHMPRINIIVSLARTVEEYSDMCELFSRGSRSATHLCSIMAFLLLVVVYDEGRDH